MNKSDNGGSAFPSQRDDCDNEGMTLRDWFAGQALGGLLATNQTADVSSYAIASYELADAMIEARKETK